MAEILLVKNMVCHRCVLMVEKALEESGISFLKVVNGEIHLKNKISEIQKEKLKQKLDAVGLELIDHKVTGLIEKIKTLVIQKARNEVDEKYKQLKLSSYLSDNLNMDYSYLSGLYSSIEGRTIENYFINQRIEKAKELLVYGEKNLSEIAFELDYSSVAHLSAQFKKVTGLTPSHFKMVGSDRRRSIDRV
jgi:AraC-like DNA-binding protein